MTLKLPRLFKIQIECFKAFQEYKNSIVVAGRRGAKSTVIRVYLVYLLINQKTAVYYLPAPEGLNNFFLSFLKLIKPIEHLCDIHRTYREVRFQNGLIEFKTLQADGVARGSEYDCIIIDEAQSCEKAHVDLRARINENLQPTLLTTNGSMIISGTAMLPSELADMYRANEDDKDWFVKKWTSYDNPHLHHAVIERMRKEMDDIAFRQEILAEFVHRSNTLFQLASVKYYEDAPKFDMIVMGVDLAISLKDSADYTALTVMGKIVDTDQYYIIDVVRGKFTFKQTMDTIKSVAKQYEVEYIAVEAVQYQAAMAQELERTSSDLVILKVYPRGDKYTRAIPMNARFENGRVFINKHIGNFFVKELTSFPLGKKRDCVDATVFAFQLLAKYQNE